MARYLPAELIKKKREGGALTADELRFLVEEFTATRLPDYQMSAFLMAVYFRGLDENETLELTECMLHSGHVVDFSDLSGFKVDKHSTGGVGDKTSLILGPIVAACGLRVPMISGRGLGHTGGTLDKLESIPGFNTQLSLEQFRQTVKKHGIALIGQTQEICPADKRLYALRDVTATVENLSLICASIMSKKLAEGIDGLVLDVKFGSGAFMKSTSEAEELARALMAIAKGYGKKVSALITNMDQPLGRYAGNALEVQECLEILRNEHGNDRLRNETRELSLQLAAQMLFLGGVGQTLTDSKAEALKVLQNGQALAKFEELCVAQSGRLQELPKAKHQLPVLASQSGVVQSMATETIGYLGLRLRAGRATVADVIEPTAGFEFHCKIGDRVEKGQPLITLYGSDSELLQEVQPLVAKCVPILEHVRQAEPLIWKELTL